MLSISCSSNRRSKKDEKIRGLVMIERARLKRRSLLLLILKRKAFKRLPFHIDRRGKNFLCIVLYSASLPNEITFTNLGINPIRFNWLLSSRSTSVLRSFLFVTTHTPHNYQSPTPLCSPITHLAYLHSKRDFPN